MAESDVQVRVLRKKTRLSVYRATELISTELRTLGNINLHTAHESITKSDSNYQHSVDFAFMVPYMLHVLLTIC